MSSGAPQRRTLWEEGQQPGRLVAVAAGSALLLVALLDQLVFDDVTVLTDIVFVVLCAAAALAVRRRDFFVVGVCPPLVMAAVFAVVAIIRPAALAEASDGFGQALVSGLAHHAGALVLGYALTFALLAIRQVAMNNSGAIRSGARPRVSDHHAA